MINLSSKTWRYQGIEAPWPSPKRELSGALWYQFGYANVFFSFSFAFVQKKRRDHTVHRVLRFWFGLLHG